VYEAVSDARGEKEAPSFVWPSHFSLRMHCINSQQGSTYKIPHPNIVNQLSAGAGFVRHPRWDDDVVQFQVEAVGLLDGKARPELARFGLEHGEFLAVFFVSVE
jgi:hypothetical protein